MVEPAHVVVAAIASRQRQRDINASSVAFDRQNEDDTRRVGGSTCRQILKLSTLMRPRRCG